MTPSMEICLIGSLATPFLRTLHAVPFTPIAALRSRAALAFWQPSLACSLDDPLEFLPESWIVGSSCSFLH